ncbi:MAG: M48 family metallopeptidase [Bacteroidota bacterium]
MELSFYPPSPSQDTASLTKPKSAYIWQIVFNLLAVFLFLLFYFAMIAGTAYLAYWAIFYPMDRVNRGSLFLKILAIAIAIMLFVFTIKFLFKRSSFEYPTRVELKPDEHPRLFQFLRRLTEETGAPFPKRVYVNEEINAMVFYNNPILSLFFPVRKNLLIGLGLVNSLNLSEFKAVLAHEFGHFAQRSMKLGSYVYMANRIIHDMVFTRDRWDHLLEQGMQSDIRIMIPSAVLFGIVWVIRQILILIYKGLNLLYASLSRQMEFNADLVAVSVSGSDAIVHSLAKLGPASEAMHHALGELSEAADHKLYSKDIFFHQANVKENVLPAASLLGRGPQLVFDPKEEAIPEMYASHPPNSQRESNAKEIYVEGAEDMRSPWVLFGNAEAIREEVSRRFYQLYFQTSERTNFQTSETVQAFLEEERAEKNVGDQYLHIYDNRALSKIEPQNLEDLQVRYPDIWHSPRENQAAIYGESFESLAHGLKTIRDEQGILLQAAQNQQKQFRFRGEVHSLKEIETLFAEHNIRLKEFEEPLRKFDEQVFVLHYRLAEEAGQEVQTELMDRYLFQMEIQQAFDRLQELDQKFQSVLHNMMSADQLSEKQVDYYCQQLRTYFQTFRAEIERKKKLQVPKLRNFDPDTDLAAYILPEEIQQPLGYDILQGTFLQAFVNALQMSLNRLTRLYQKNMGGILRLQESLTEEIPVSETPSTSDD